MAGTALSIAAAVRAGERRAADVLDEHLAAIAAGDAEIHAFNLVLGDEARAAASAWSATRAPWAWPCWATSCPPRKRNNGA